MVGSDQAIKFALTLPAREVATSCIINCIGDRSPKNNSRTPGSVVVLHVSSSSFGNQNTDISIVPCGSTSRTTNNRHFNNLIIEKKKIFNKKKR